MMERDAARYHDVESDRGQLYLRKIDADCLGAASRRTLVISEPNRIRGCTLLLLECRGLDYASRFLELPTPPTRS